MTLILSKREEAITPLLTSPSGRNDVWEFLGVNYMAEQISPYPKMEQISPHLRGRTNNVEMRFENVVICKE